MKQVSPFLNGVLLSILAFILFFTVMPGTKAGAQATQTPAPQPADTCSTSRSIAVTGTAVVNVLPDRVLVQLGVQSNGRTAAAVQAANTLAIQKMSKAVQALGVSPEDISTDWYIIEPIYEDYDSLHIKGYRINNTVALTVKDVARANDIITAALMNGANQVINVELYTSELRKYRDQAREMAMQAAVEKAQALAQAAGAQAGCVLSINENSRSYYNGWYGGYGSSRTQNMWTQNAVQNAAPSGGTSGSLSDDGPVSLGKISVKAEVSVTFNLY